MKKTVLIKNIRHKVEDTISKSFGPTVWPMERQLY